MGFKQFLKDMAERQKFGGADARGWVNNGLQELQQAFHPSVQQILPGDNATLGKVTSGEMTNERRELSKEAPEPEPDMDQE